MFSVSEGSISIAVVDLADFFFVSMNKVGDEVGFKSKESYIPVNS